jgi:DNA invertase Pin-like site-specific DNA recombinase
MKEEVEIFQNVFGMEKKAAVASFIELEGEKADAFWMLYDEYETKRKDLGKQRIQLINNYAENYENMTDEKIDELFKESVKVNGGLAKLATSYYKKMKKAVDTKTAAQFFQIENYFQSAIRYEISSLLPFIGEFENN